jgi:hypothetical protein
VQKLVAVFLLLNVLILTGPVADAQVLYGSIVGSVTDQSGAVVPKAEVRATSPDTGETRTVTTDDSGRYTIGNVVPGTYQVVVTAPGFSQTSSAGVSASVNTVTRLDVQMQLGSQTQTVNVSAAATALQTDKSDTHSEITQHEMANLPLPNYRNFQSLFNLVPGATPVAFTNSITDTPQRPLSTNVNGTNRNNNNTRVDGAADIFVWLPHATLYVPPEETIEAVNIATGSFDAEQGMAGGSAVTITTKSGTNDFHGVAFGFWDNNMLAARNFFYYGNGTPFSLHNIDGATIGGPIVKNKLFFFAGWEGNRERTNYSALSTVPTLAERNGDFSAFGTTIYDPRTGDSTGKGKTAFLNNQVPQNLFSPITQKLQALIPLPNQPGTTNNYFSSGIQALDRDNIDAKIDWNRTDNHHIFGKYSVMKALVNCQFSLGAAGGTGLCNGNGAGTAPTLTQLATLGHSWILGPNLLLDQVLGFSRMGQHGTDSFYGQNIGLDLGIPGTNGPDIRQSGFPIFNITGFSSLGQTANYSPFWRNDQTWTNSDNLTWTRGAHELRFGFDMVRFQLNQWQPEAGNFGPRGLFTFDGGVTALNGGKSPNQYNAYAQFLLGLDTNVGKTLQNIYLTGREWQFGWYARDRWQVSRKLTVNLGLRYELYPLVTRSNSGIGRFDLATNNIIIGGLGNNDENAGVTVSHKMFAPRIGIAYRLTESTVIRMGYGISYDPLPMARVFRDPYPLTIPQSFVAPNSFVPYANISAGIPPVSVPDLSTGIAPVPTSTVISRSPFPGLLHRGYIQSYNFTIERQLPSNFVVSAGYVGTSTTHQFVDHEMNAGFPGSGTALLPLNATLGRKVSTLFEDGWLSSNYNSLQIALTRRFSNGLMLKGAYTRSKAIDMADDDGRVGLLFNDPSQIYRNRAVSGFDIPNNFQIGGLYDLPFGKGKQFVQSGIASYILEGWELNGTFSAYSGVPFTVTASGASLNAPNNTQTADQVLANVAVLGGIGSGHPYYDPTAFAPVTAVRFGNAGRNILRSPRIFNANVSIFRTFPFNERIRLQFRAEAANVSNTPHFLAPNANVSAGNFLAITSAMMDQRQFRLGLKLMF